MHDEFLLDDVQKDLLSAFVEAERSVPGDRRGKFLVMTHLDSPCDLFIHPGGPRVEGNLQDAELLAMRGLLAQSFGSRGTPQFWVTPEGNAYCEDCLKSPVAATSPAVSAARQVSDGLTAEYLTQQFTRMESAIHEDPALAIGTAKEFIETCCKTILGKLGHSDCADWDMPKLVHETCEQLRLVPGQYPQQDAISRSIRRVLGNLAQLAQGAAELRNLYGTGHGQAASTPAPPAHHARLAVGAASTLAVFLFETLRYDHEDR